MSRKRPESNGDQVESPVPIDDPSPNPAPDPPEDDRPNMPAHVVRFGLVRACIWRNDTDQGVRHNVTVSRIYLGNDQRWHSTQSFGLRDLLPLAKALDWAHTWIAQEIAGSDAPF